LPLGAAHGAIGKNRSRYRHDSQSAVLAGSCEGEVMTMDQMGASLQAAAPKVAA
jgi:hypothetical protein